MLRPEKMSFSERRSNRLVSSDMIRYFKPLLYRKQTAFNSATVMAQFSKAALKHDLFELRDGIGRPVFCQCSLPRRASACV